MKKLVLLALLAASPAVADTEQHRVARCVDILDRMKDHDYKVEGQRGFFESETNRAFYRLRDIIRLTGHGLSEDEITERAQGLLDYSRVNCSSERLVPELASCLGWMAYPRVFDTHEGFKNAIEVEAKYNLPPHLKELGKPSITEDLPFPYKNLPLWQETFLSPHVPDFMREYLKTDDDDDDDVAPKSAIMRRLLEEAEKSRAEKDKLCIPED